MTKRQKVFTPRELAALIAHAREHGVEAAAREYGVQGSAVHRWLRGSALTSDGLRTMLAIADLTPAAAARHLGLSARMFRYYLAGEKVIPRVVELAVEALVGQRERRHKGRAGTVTRVAVARRVA
jgi:hypothetical protein